MRGSFAEHAKGLPVMRNERPGIRLATDFRRGVYWTSRRLLDIRPKDAGNSDQ